MEYAETPNACIMKAITNATNLVKVLTAAVRTLVIILFPIFNPNLLTGVRFKRLITSKNKKTLTEGNV